MEVPFLSEIHRFSSLEDIARALDHLPVNEIRYTPWAAFPYKPECAFTIAHADDCIFLKFFVVEDDTLVRFTQPNDPVYRDSCVEFFIAFNNDQQYYNLEFNSIGTCFLGYGSGKADLQAADVEVVKQIKSSFVLSCHEGQMKWELTVVIPNEVFYNHWFKSLAGKTGRANFFKCGDDLPVPHYLSWRNIESAQPNFHLPQFFGKIIFNDPLAG